MSQSQEQVRFIIGNAKFLDMSKNHSKELMGVYKRCLSSLSATYKTHKPNSEQWSKFVAVANKEASKRTFESAGKKEQWIKYRVEELYSEAFVKANLDPNGQLKKQIEDKIASLG